MTTILKQKVLDYIKSERRSIRELERQAGLNYNAIQSILNDRSKSPSIDTVLKIADALDCSLDEIVGRKKFTPQSVILTESTKPLNINLFQEVCSFVGKFIESKKLEELHLSDAVYCIEEIYQYCISVSLETLDRKFAQWFIEQKFKNIL